MDLCAMFLLGWARVVSGHFSAVEIAMTMIIGIASTFGIATSIRWRTRFQPWAAAGIVTLFAALQLLAFRVSMISCIRTQ